MTSYNTDQEEFVIEIFYSCGGSCVAAELQQCREFSVRVAPSRDTICCIFKRCKKNRKYM
jgi:hypothetical protein